MEQSVTAHPASKVRATASKFELRDALKVIASDDRTFDPFVRYFDLLATYTPAAHWEDASQPYPMLTRQVNDIAIELGRSRRQVNTVETQFDARHPLCQFPMIERLTGPNGERRGGSYPLGISARPLIENAAAIIARANSILSDRAKVAELKTRCKQLRQSIRVLSHALPAIMQERVKRAATKFYVRYDRLSLSQMKRLARFLQRILNYLQRLLDSNLQHDTSHDVATDSPRYDSQNRHKTVGNQNPISSDQIAQAMTPELRYYVENIQDAGKAMTLRGKEIGIEGVDIQRSIERVGFGAALLTFLIVDRNLSHPTTPIRSPSKAFEAMIQRAVAGKLNLNGSIFGILKRQSS